MRLFNNSNGSENGHRANGYRKPARYSALGLIGHGLSGSDWPRAWRAHDLRPSYDVVIVGGGVHGLATAYYLAKRASRGGKHRHRRARRDRGVVLTHLEQPLAGFLDSVASDEPAPGGAATAVAAALAAGLSGMSARPSADYLVDATGLAERADRLRRRVAPLAQEDATAYGHVLAAYRNQHAGAPGVRRERIRTALSGAADVPLANSRGRRRGRGPPGTGGQPEPEGRRGRGRSPGRGGGACRRCARGDQHEGGGDLR